MNIILKICVVVTLIVTGCGPWVKMLVVDHAPMSLQKGFVEFSIDGKESNYDYSRWIDIWTIRPGILIPDTALLEGWVYDWSHWDLDVFPKTYHKMYLRLASTPGIHHFCTDDIGIKKKFEVKIEEGKITPVRFVYEFIDKTEPKYIGGSRYTITVNYNVKTYVGDPIPISSYPNIDCKIVYPEKYKEIYYLNQCYPPK